MLDDLNMLLTGGAGIAGAKKIAEKLPKKSKKDQKIHRMARQTKVDSTENISSKMKATARDATPPADEEYVNKKAGGYMKKMKKGGKTGKYTCSHNRLY
jgi:hypothetical protein